MSLQDSFRGARSRSCTHRLVESKFSDGGANDSAKCAPQSQAPPHINEPVSGEVRRPRIQSKTWQRSRNFVDAIIVHFDIDRFQLQRVFSFAEFGRAAMNLFANRGRRIWERVQTRAAAKRFDFGRGRARGGIRSKRACRPHHRGRREANPPKRRCSFSHALENGTARIRGVDCARMPVLFDGAGRRGWAGRSDSGLDCDGRHLDYGAVEAGWTSRDHLDVVAKIPGADRHPIRSRARNGEGVSHLALV